MALKWFAHSTSSILHTLQIQLYKYMRRMVETCAQTEAINWGQVYIKDELILKTWKNVSIWKLVWYSYFALKNHILWSEMELSYQGMSC